MSSLGSRQHVESLGHFFDNLASDRQFTGGKTGKQGVVAKVVNVARNTFSATIDVIDGVGLKNVGSLSAADEEARRDVAIGFFNGR